MIETKSLSVTTYPFPKNGEVRERQPVITPTFNIETNHILVSRLLNKPEYQRLGTTHVFKKDQLLFDSCEDPDTIYYLNSGSIDFTIPSTDRTRKIKVGPFNQPGFMFDKGISRRGFVEPTSEPRGFKMIEGKAAVWQINYRDLKALIHNQDPLGTLLSYNLLASFSLYYDRLDANSYEAAYFKLHERIAAYLLRNEEEALLRTSHSNIADRLGTFRESVSEELRKFKDQQAVELAYGRITVTNRELLENTAFELWDPETPSDF